MFTLITRNKTKKLKDSNRLGQVGGRVFAEHGQGLDSTLAWKKDANKEIIEMEIKF